MTKPLKIMTLPLKEPPIIYGEIKEPPIVYGESFSKEAKVNQKAAKKVYDEAAKVYKKAMKTGGYDGINPKPGQTGK